MKMVSEIQGCFFSWSESFFSAAPCHLAMATKTSNSGGFPVELPHVEVDGVATGQPEASIGGLWLHNVAHRMWIVVPEWPAEHSGAAKANHQWFRIMDSISLLGRIWDQNTSLLNKWVIGRPTRSKFKINWNEFYFFNERSNECSGISSHFEFIGRPRAQPHQAPQAHQAQAGHIHGHFHSSLGPKSESSEEIVSLPVPKHRSHRSL